VYINVTDRRTDRRMTYHRALQSIAR